MTRCVALFALLLCLARPGVGGDEAWVIEGESLEGTRDGGTALTYPRITHGSLVVTAAEGRLDADRDLLYLINAVRIVDSTRVLTAEHGSYRRSAKLLELYGRVHGQGPEGEMQAGELTYDRATGILKLRVDPLLEDSVDVVRAERIDYWRDSSLAVATGAVQILLKQDSTRVHGRSARYRRDSGVLQVTGDPWIESPGGAGQPDLIVHSDTLVLEQVTQVGEARGHVRITRGDVHATSGRAWFRLKQNRVLLADSPVAWEPDGQVHADTMSIAVEEGRPDRLVAFGNVKVRYQPRGKPGEQNLVLGDTLLARIDGRTLSDLLVAGNATSLYVPALHDVQQGSGRNLSRAERIRVDLRAGEARRVDLLGAATGVYLYPGGPSLETLRDPPESLRVPADTAAIDWALPPPPLLSTFERTRTMDLPESLLTPYDRLFDQRVEYKGDTIRFFVREDRILIRGHGEIDYQGSSLRSGEIEYLAARELVLATDEPTLRDAAGEEVGGERMTYRTDLKEGFVYQGRTEFDGAYYSGKEVKKLADNELLVRSGDYTTCDHDPPHYVFHSERMKLKQNDKVVARPVILRVLDIPILALPYYFFPMDKGRHSGLLLPDVELGWNSYRGRFLRNLGYYWAISDYMDTRVWANYYEDGNNLDLNGNFRYNVRYLLNGNFDGSFGNRRSAPGGRSRQYTVTGAHQHQLGETSRLTLSANFTSSKTYRSDLDFGATVDERLNRVLKSQVGLEKTWSRARLSGNATRTEYMDETAGNGRRLDLALPSLDLSINRIALGRARDSRGRGGRLPALSTTYVGTSWALRSVYTSYFPSGGAAVRPLRKPVDNRAVRQNLSLSDTRSIGPYLRVTPQLSGRGAVFWKDSRGRLWRGGASWSGSLSAGNTLYGTWNVSRGPIAGLRHVVEPTASWNYAPSLPALTYRDSTGVRRARFPSVGDISLSGSKGSSMSFGLTQRLHVKIRRGEKVLKKENLLTLGTTSGYNFLAKGASKPLSAVRNSLQFRPYSLFTVDASTTHDPYSRRLQSFQANTSLTLSPEIWTRAAADTAAPRGPAVGGFGETGKVASSRAGAIASQPRTALGWTLNAGHSYSSQPGSARPSQSLNLRLQLSPTSHWRWNGAVYLDLRRKEVISHELTLDRDLHCWAFTFTHRMYGSRSEYSFRIWLRSIPEVKYTKERH